MCTQLLTHPSYEKARLIFATKMKPSINVLDFFPSHFLEELAPTIVIFLKSILSHFRITHTDTEQCHKITHLKNRTKTNTKLL